MMLPSRPPTFRLCVYGVRVDVDRVYVAYFYAIRIITP